MGDSFLLKTAVPASIIVSICGGALIIQSSTTTECKKFGLIYPHGSTIWTINFQNKYVFESNLKWSQRKKIAIFAVSGDNLRKDLYLKYKKYLMLQNFEVIGTDGSISWKDYCTAIQSSALNINTSLIKKNMKAKLQNLTRKLPKTYVTGRIFEGFCSGAVVITNSSEVLRELGFIVGLDYLDLDDLLRNNFVLPSTIDLENIAKRGNKKFNNLIKPITLKI